MTGIIQQLFRDPPYQIVIVGDVMLDRYLMGKVSRVSPEAPVPVVHFQEQSDRLGGAANVALNLKALGATPYLFSVCGEDEEGVRLERLLTEQGLSIKGLIKEPGRRTTVKTRVMAGGQHLLRVDTEDIHPINDATSQQILERLKELIKEVRPEIILIQDYNKGVLETEFIQELVALANKEGVKTAVDPKFRNFLAYKGVTLFKPNLKELCEGLGMDIRPVASELVLACRRLNQHLGHSLSMVTLSDKGAFWYDHRDETYGLCPSLPRDIVDVCGAGDTVIATASVALAAGVKPELIALLSNLAGGLVCERSGVVPVDRNAFLVEIKENLSNS